MKSCVLIACTVVLLASGCRQERKPVLPSTPAGVATQVPTRTPEAALPPTGVWSNAAAPAMPPTSTGAQSATSQELPPDVLVQVNDRVLKLPAAAQEVDILIAANKGSIPPQQLEQVRRQALKTVVEQFVANTLLGEEADRLGVTLTAEDETNAAANLQAMLPPGVTVEQAISQSPVGEARFRSEMLTAARIKKMLRTVDTAETRISEADFTAFTNQFRTQIEVSDSARARHILVATKPTDDAAEREKKRQFAESIRTQLLAGADFAALAKQHSDCPSKDAGGDLGRFGRRKMVKPFSDAAFQQPVNAIGDVVETQFGYHVVQVTERNVIGRDDVMDIMRRQRLLERLAKSAKIRFNPPPQTPRRNPATSRRPSPSSATNTAEGILDANPTGSTP